MKRVSLFLGMIAFMAFTTSCETDNVEQDNQGFQTKSVEFNAEDTYYSIIANTESGMTQFDALIVSQKQDVWVFKYTRFKNDNSLNGLQVEAIDELLSFVDASDFNEGNEVLENSLESDVRALFTEEQSDFLLFTLENGLEDVEVSLKCFWCRQWEETAPCHEEFVNGESIGFYTSGTSTTRRFWFRTNREFNVLRPC
jgi:hypothetical protein